MTSEKFGAGSFWVNWQTIQRNVWKVEQKKTKKFIFELLKKTVTFLTVLKNWLNFYLTTQSACQPTNHSLSKIKKQMNSWKMRHDSIRTTIDLNMCIRVCVWYSGILLAKRYEIAFEWQMLNKNRLHFSFIWWKKIWEITPHTIRRNISLKPFNSLPPPSPTIICMKKWIHSFKQVSKSTRPAPTMLQKPREDVHERN